MMPAGDLVLAFDSGSLASASTTTASCKEQQPPARGGGTKQQQGGQQQEAAAAVPGGRRPFTLARAISPLWRRSHPASARPRRQQPPSSRAGRALLAAGTRLARALAPAWDLLYGWLLMELAFGALVSGIIILVLLATGALWHLRTAGAALLWAATCGGVDWRLQPLEAAARGACCSACRSPAAAAGAAAGAAASGGGGRLHRCGQGSQPPSADAAVITMAAAAQWQPPHYVARLDEAQLAPLLQQYGCQTISWLLGTNPEVGVRGLLQEGAR
jgi:hypothetical protein